MRIAGRDSWMARIGYARGSTTDQHLGLRRDALQDHGISEGESKRGGLSRVLRALRKGDVLVV